MEEGLLPPPEGECAQNAAQEHQDLRSKTRVLRQRITSGLPPSFLKLQPFVYSARKMFPVEQVLKGHFGRHHGLNWAFPEFRRCA